MKIGRLDFLCVPHLYCVKRGGGTIYAENPDLFQIAYMLEMTMEEAKSEFKTIEEARDSLTLRSKKSVEQEINRYVKILEEHGCTKTQVKYSHQITSLSADSPNNSKIGIISCAIVAISGGKTGNIKIYGFKK